MILNGECGAFNPLLLECLNESSELLRQELQRNEWDRSFHQDTHRLSEEILHREALPRRTAASGCSTWNASAPSSMRTSGAASSSTTTCSAAG